MVTIIKANGERQEFSEEKLLASIKRARIPQHMQQEVLAHITNKLYNNIPTHEIYQYILGFLDKNEHVYHRAKYSLKQSLMDLGPTGYPFEDYVSKLLTAEGFTTSVRNILQGTCVNHEIDIVAQRGNDKIMIEAKFHNNSGIKTDIQVALYTYARFEDLQKKYAFTKPLLITNTKVTSDVISYATCKGMDIISWDYPQGDSLREAVETYGLYPITALSRLPSTYKQQLLEKGIVLCKDLVANQELFHTFSLTGEEKTSILAEATFLSKKGDQ